MGERDPGGASGERFSCRRGRAWRFPARTWTASGGRAFSSSCPPWPTSRACTSSRSSNPSSDPSTGRCRAGRAGSWASVSTSACSAIRSSGTASGTPSSSSPCPCPPPWCSPSLAAINVWVRLGFDTMIFLAALQAIPGEYYEAAAMDGARARQQFWHVTLPLLNPQVVMVCILELIFNFKIFDQVYATTQGGPAGASQTIIPLLYDTAFKYFRLGEASVLDVFVFVVLLVVTLLQWRIFRRPVDY